MFFDQQLVRVRPGKKTDRGGNQIDDWSDAAVTLLTLTGMNIQPASQTETPTAERTALVTAWHVQSAPGPYPDVQATDRIRWNGMVLEVIGEIAPWTDPLDGTPHHAEWTMTRATG